MKLLVAMSGGVDSSVAAARLVDAGHDVTGVTMKLWGGDSDTGCCSVADVDDARRAAQHLGIDHLVFNFGDDFLARVVDPYVAAHAAGTTPNPCIECNRHLKFDRLISRAEALGFDGVATGHHARLVTDAAGHRRVARGADAAKDQSYVLYVVEPDWLDRVWLPVGDLTKAEVRAEAARLGLRTAAKPDSQDVCFITASAGRRAFLEPRIELHPARVVDGDGRQVGSVDAVELVTVGQRRGLGLAGEDAGRYAVEVDVAGRQVRVGRAGDLEVSSTVIGDLVWGCGVEPAPGSGDGLVAQCSAHGRPRPVAVESGPEPDTCRLRWIGSRQPRVAPGQSVVLYHDDLVIGGGIAR
jgi:tRNA-uridine 2-sulfurtransferase